MCKQMYLATLNRDSPSWWAVSELTADTCGGFFAINYVIVPTLHEEYVASRCSCR